MKHLKKEATPTLKSIAERTGYTVNTVSQALRGLNSVSAETGLYIRRVAREMGYVSNLVASSLRSGKTHTVALAYGDVSNMLFAIKIRELEKVFCRHGYQVLILNTDEDAEKEYRAIYAAISRKVDGVILCPCQRSREALSLMDQFRVPYVLSGRDFQDTNCDSVVWADYDGGLLATRHLIARGCRRILMLNGPEAISSVQDRGRGYRDAVAEAGLEPFELHLSSMSGGVRDALDAHWAEASRFDGLFAFSDLMAMEAACWLQARGIAIPRDVRMVGFDDILSHVSIPFALTSVAADKTMEIQSLAELLIRRMEGEATPPPERRVMAVRLVERASG